MDSRIDLVDYIGRENELANSNGTGVKAIIYFPEFDSTNRAITVVFVDGTSMRYYRDGIDETYDTKITLKEKPKVIWYRYQWVSKGKAIRYTSSTWFNSKEVLIRNFSHYKSHGPIITKTDW